MKLGHGNEIKFELAYETKTSYVVILDGEPTMNIVCDSADPDKVIKLVSRDGNHVVSTKGRFEMTVKMTEDADGAPLGVEPRVDSKSVYKYVAPRTHSLLGRLLRAATA